MTSRREQKERLRRERVARQRATEVAKRRRRRLQLLGGCVLGIAAIGALIAVLSAGSGGGSGSNSGDFPSGAVPAQKVSGLSAAASAAGCVVRSPKDEGNQHVTGTVSYKSNPPASGPHDPVPADDGAYARAPEIEKLVHELEHGRIIIWFKPSAPAQIRGDLKALFDEDSYHVVLTPNQTGMSYEVAASAWDHVLGCRSFNPGVFDALRAFRNSYRDQGPERVP